MTSTERAQAIDTDSLPPLAGAAADEVSTNGITRRQPMHLLDIDSLTPQEITTLLNSSEGMLEVLGRDVKKTPALRGKTIVTVFYENSTRTRISFEEAGKVLGADVINVSVSSSSVSKGESLYNTALTLQAMQVDALVIRHPHSGGPHFVARHVNAPVVNAGDGMHAHPTQTLLDLFTLRQRLGDIAGKKVAIIGDVLYSRVARSDILGFLMMGAEVVVCGPPTLLPSGWRPGVSPVEPGMEKVQIVRTVEEALDGADAVMTLRIQRERQDAGHLPDLFTPHLLHGRRRDVSELARQEFDVDLGQM